MSHKSIESKGTEAKSIEKLAQRVDDALHEPGTQGPRPTTPNKRQNVFLRAKEISLNLVQYQTNK